MKKVPLAFLTCLLIAASLSSCDRISDGINALFEKSPTSSYQIDVSEGRTEVEKTLIIQYNNLMYVLIPFAERVKKGEKPASAIKDYDALKISWFVQIVHDHTFEGRRFILDVDQKLVQKMLKNIENILSSTGNQNLQEMASGFGEHRKKLYDGFPN